MKVIYDSKFNVDVVLVEQGEYFASKEHEVLSTTLGSCISVCLYDLKNKIGGLNHYMLPEPFEPQHAGAILKAKYGVKCNKL